MIRGQYYIPENSDYICSGSVPDGYNGGRANCVFQLKDKSVYVCHNSGYYRIGLDLISSVDEAKATIQYHAKNWNYQII